MLGNKSVAATLAVKDMAKTKEFYEDKLGLKPQGDVTGGGQMYKSGDSMIFVYESKFAGTNEATAATWGVGKDLEKVIEDLKSKGVKFEHYEMPETERKGDIHWWGEMGSAWFKDPSGNILNLVNQM